MEFSSRLTARLHSILSPHYDEISFLVSLCIKGFRHQNTKWRTYRQCICVSVISVIDWPINWQVAVIGKLNSMNIITLIDLEQRLDIEELDIFCGKSWALNRSKFDLRYFLISTSFAFGVKYSIYTKMERLLLITSSIYWINGQGLMLIALKDYKNALN